MELPENRPSQMRVCGGTEPVRRWLRSDGVKYRCCGFLFTASVTIAVLVIHSARVFCCQTSSGVDTSCIRHPRTGMFAASKLLIQPLLQVLQTHFTMSSGLCRSFGVAPLMECRSGPLGFILSRIQIGQRCSRVSAGPSQNRH